MKSLMRWKTVLLRRNISLHKEKTMKPALQHWELFYNDGIAYGKRAISGSLAETYSPEVLHGLASMAAEKLFMSIIMYHGKMPMGHTFFDLITAASEYFTIEASLKTILLEMDQIVPLCSLDPAKSWRVDPARVPSFISAVKMTRDAVDSAFQNAGKG